MNLNGKWKLYYYHHSKLFVNSVDELKSKSVPSITGTVPGNVELDLIAAGMLPEDIFKGENILKAEPYEYYDWWYETEFKAEVPKDGQKVLLHFGGVDCIADYYINGKLIGDSDNMFIEHEFDVTDILNYGEHNTLHVHIYSPLTATVDAEEFNVDVLRCTWNPTSINIRKPPHCYGWDIMPRAVSAGIWRGVELIYRDSCYFKTLQFNLRSVETGCGNIEMLYQADFGFDNNIRFNRIIIKGSCGDSSFVSEQCTDGIAGAKWFQIPNIKLWWPKGYGEPNLYDITVEIFTPEGELLVSKKLRQGFRTLELRRSESVEPGGCFDFIVNGVKVMVCGMAWVPMDVYHSRDRERYTKALLLADDLKCNMLRCWGGNVYEENEFFDFCDEHGIMVWQDFGMACLYYPQDDGFAEKIRKEVTAVVKRLKNYACLVLWCGDNEVDLLNGWKGLRPSRNRLTREVIPKVLSDLDPDRPYIASSPYVSDEAWKSGRSAYPEDHLWDPRDYFKSKTYLDSNAYFISEIGYHGCPAKESIEKFIDAEFVWPENDNKQWNLHSSNQFNNSDRTMLMRKQIMQFFGKVPETLDEFVVASQISQAEGDKFFIEMIRSKMDSRGGIMIWNLIDGWPQMSDAVVDYYYNKKLAYNYIKRSGNPVMVMIDEMEGWGQSVVVCNSTLKEADIKIKITDIETGKIYYEKECIAGANKNTRLDKLPIMYSDKGMFLIEYTVNGTPFINTYLYGTPAFDLDCYIKWMNKADEAEKKFK